MAQDLHWYVGLEQKHNCTDRRHDVWVKKLSEHAALQGFPPNVWVYSSILSCQAATGRFDLIAATLAQMKEASAPSTIPSYNDLLGLLHMHICDDCSARSAETVLT